MTTPDRRAQSAELQAKNRALLDESFRTRTGRGLRDASDLLSAKIQAENKESPVLAPVPEKPAKQTDFAFVPSNRRLKFVLPYPPSANRYWRHAVTKTRAGNFIATTYVSDEGADYKKFVADFGERRAIEPLKGNLRFEMTVFRPQRSGDISNRIKVVEDALQGVAYINDSQIEEIHVFRREDKDRPRVEIYLQEI